jgi:hypothetical protein
MVWGSMTTSAPLPRTALNQLRRGLAYSVSTVDGTQASGEYAGIEVAYEEWSILLVDHGQARSIPLDRVARIDRIS